MQTVPVFRFSRIWKRALVAQHDRTDIPHYRQKDMGSDSPKPNPHAVFRRFTVDAIRQVDTGWAWRGGASCWPVQCVLV